MAATGIATSTAAVKSPGEHLERTVPRHRRLGPLEEAIGLHARTDVGSRQRELLPKIQRRAELLDGLLPGLDFGNTGTRRQPSCQRLFAGTCSRQGEQLEQRAAAKQIEIVRVDVIVVAKSIAGLAGSNPAVLEPGQTTLVKGDASDGRVARADDLIVTRTSHTNSTAGTNSHQRGKP